MMMPALPRCCRLRSNHYHCNNDLYTRRGVSEEGDVENKLSCKLRRESANNLCVHITMFNLSNKTISNDLINYHFPLIIISIG